MLERQIERHPTVETARERQYLKAALGELERHTGARSFVGSGAEQHERPIQAQRCYAVLELVQRDANRSGDRVREGVELQRLTQIDDL